MTETAVHEEQFEFQTEVKQLLHIIIYSLYSKKEIFIRELISNASDALDKMRIKMLVEKDIEDKDTALEIHINLDENHKVFSISDTGIGMTKGELIQHIGTIAKSGTLEFIKMLAEGDKKDVNLIGQFGVGFYSSFMVAKEVMVVTNPYLKDEPSHIWHSDGSGSYSIKELPLDKRGTKVEVHLKDEEKDFVNAAVVEDIIKRYSNFVSYPIYVNGKQVNQVAAIWTKQKSEIKKEEYDEFYKFVSNAFDEPLSHMHFSSDAPLSFYSILYVPKTNLETMGLGKIENGLSLYSTKVLIQAECKELLPDYLRFIQGVVDSEDISLNVSREMIQDNVVLRKIKKFIVKKILDHLLDMLKNNRDDYLVFWNQFLRIIKEGVAQDFENRLKIADLLLFNSSKCADTATLITFKEYVERMKEDQKEIYYISGLDRTSVENSPHIEIFKKKDFEVLYFYDPLDDIVAANLMQYDGKTIKSVDQSDIEFIKDAQEPEEGQEEESLAFNSKFDNFLKLFKDTLADKVVEVKESKRLSDSPCVLLNPENSPSSNIQKIMSMMNKDFQMSKKILEVNKHHPLIRNLTEIIDEASKESFIKTCCEQLYDNALMLDGLLPGTTDMIPRLHKIMEEATKRS